MSPLKHLLLTLTLAASALAAFAAEPPVASRTEVIYHRKFGTALTFDVIKPTRPNGYAAIYMVSGGFFSSHEAIDGSLRGGLLTPLLERGYTVFAVVHGSQPRFVIPEITDDIHRAVRFIRHHAADYGVKPDRFGIFGASAGGHLSLTMGTQGGPGKADAKDPIDRESSAVQAVAAFFPPTDYLNWRSQGDDAVGVGVLKDFKPAFGARSDTAESRATYGKEISPLNFVKATMPPTLLVHGDADQLVPIYQAEIFVKQAEAAGVKVPVKLIRKPGLLHGWPGIEQDVVTFADWFDEHLRGVKK
jgi:acetyl esterase/lipase